MYDLLFTNNFYINFLNSFLFIFFNIIFSYVIHFKLLKRNLIISEYQPLIILFLIFATICTIFNFIISLNGYKYFRETLILILSCQLIYIIKNIILLKKINFELFKFNKNNLFIFFIFIVFFLISILPISDADSIALHQNLANEIYFRGLSNYESEKNLSFTIYSNTQNLLIISPILNSDNFGAQLNLIVLFFFYLLNSNNNKNFIIILFASPLIIYFISSQKLQLFFGILYLIIFISINKKIIKNKISLFIVIFLIFFYSSGNISYILFSIPLLIYLIIQQQNNRQLVVFYSLIAAIIIFLPLFTVKQLYFDNILAPFLDNILGDNKVLYKAYSYSIKNTGGWMTNPTNYTLYLKPFISLSLNSFTTSFGIFFILMLFNIKLQKKTKFIPMIIILIVISTGQILPRYYLEAFLILAYYFKLKNLFIKILIGSHNLIIFIISLGFIYYAYFSNNVFKNKNEFMNKYSYSYFNSKEQLKLNLEGNILDNVNRPSTFFKDNIYSYRTLNVMEQYNHKSNYFGPYLRRNNINYIINNKNFTLPDCLKIRMIGKTERKMAVRNYFKNNLPESNEILKIISNNC